MPLTEDQKKNAVELLTRMLRLLGYEAEATLETDGDREFVSIKTEEAGRIIGRKGYALQSVELLLNRMLRRSHPDCPWVEVDVDGYERKRPADGRGRRRKVDEERLTRMATDAAKEVRRWGQPKRIGPFNAAERRVIHMALREDPEVETESEEPEKDGRKRVVVRLAANS